MLLGPTVVQVRAGSTKPNECFGAVRAHLRTLK